MSGFCEEVWLQICNKKIIICGVRRPSLFMAQMLHDMGGSIEAFIDDCDGKYGNSINNINVLSVEQLELCKKDAVFACSYSVELFYDMLRTVDVDDIIDLRAYVSGNVPSFFRKYASSYLGRDYINERVINIPIFPPPRTFVIESIIYLNGWAIPSYDDTHIEIVRAGKECGRAFRKERFDVIANYPYHNTKQCGYNYIMDMGKEENGSIEVLLYKGNELLSRNVVTYSYVGFMMAWEQLKAGLEGFAFFKWILARSELINRVLIKAEAIARENYQQLSWRDKYTVLQLLFYEGCLERGDIQQLRIVTEELMRSDLFQDEYFLWTMDHWKIYTIAPEIFHEVFLSNADEISLTNKMHAYRIMYCLECTDSNDITELLGIAELAINGNADEDFFISWISKYWKLYSGCSHDLKELCFCNFNKLKCMNQMVILKVLKFLDVLGEDDKRRICDVFNLWWRSNKSEANSIGKRLYETVEASESIKKWVSGYECEQFKSSDALVDGILIGAKNVLFTVLANVCDETERVIHLSGGVTFEYDNLFDLSVIMKEILIDEDYYFETNKEAPFIIDAGANVGMATYYFKQLYPNAKIIAFEPVPRLFEILERNIKRNGWKDVLALPFAVTDTDGDEVIFYEQDYGLSGSLEKRNMEGVEADKIHEIIVKTAKLSKYISGVVDYLKLDIEGSETKVITEISDKLDNINAMFIEFHEGVLKGNNSISTVLSCLEQHGFVVNLTKSYDSEKKTIKRPMNYVGNRVSEVIWAKRAR